MRIALAAIVAVAFAASSCTSAPPAGPASEVEVVVRGNRTVSEKELREMALRELTSFATEGHRASDAFDAAYAMERGLHARGHAHADVGFAIEPSETEPRRLVFEVEEGARATLGTVTFEGLRAIPAERAAALFHFPREGFLRLRHPPFRRSDVDAAVAGLERLYLLDGYADARVGPARITWNADATRADVVVPVVEGPRHVVGSVRIEGTLDAAELARTSAALPLVGRAYHARLPAEAAARVRGGLRDRGHALAKVEARAELDPAAATATIIVTVEPGPRVVTRSVTVSGAERTNVEFLRGLIPLGPGDVLAASDLDRAVDKLYETGVLRSVRMDVKTTDPAVKPVVADLTAAVEELEARSVEVGGGWGSYELLRGHVGYRDRNLFGRARVLDLELNGSLRGAGIEGRVLDRYLLGRDWFTELSASYQRREEPSFDRRTAAMELSARRELPGRLRVRAGYLVRAEEAESVDAPVAGVEESGFVRSAGPFARITRDKRDDPLFPTGGTLSEVGVFRSVPALGADLDFLEVTASAAGYLKLAEETVLAVGVRFQTRDLQQSGETLPIQERLFLGGATTVRSFGESELGPSRRGKPLGGLTSALASAELRRRLAGNLDGALFYDIGAVSVDSWDVGGPRGSAIGVGVRYRLPVGPARLDIAWNPGDRFAANRSWAVHFAFGFSF